MQRILKKVLPSLLASCVLFIDGARSQVPDETTVRENTSRLSVTIKMDQDTYFPGELYEATIEVRNASSEPLLVTEPFQSGCVTLSRRGDDGKLESLMGPDDRCPQNWMPVVILGPGESRKEVLHSYGDSLWPALTATGGAPGLAATYTLSYSYGPGRFAEFAVVSPQLEADTVARVKDIMFSDRPDGSEPHRIPAYVHVFAVRGQNQSYICVAQQEVTNLERNPRATKPELGPGLIPFKRVAISQEPVAELSARADSDENLTIEWTTSSGRQQRTFYEASYVVRDARERARKLMLEELNRDK